MMTISCIVPTLNEERGIKNLITSIENQVLPQDVRVVEIIVVDNGSVDNTTTIASSMGASVYIQPQLTIGGLRNYGAEKATGNVIFFLDADNILTEHTIHSLAKMILTNEVGAIGVQLRPSDDHWVSRIWHYQSYPETPGYHEKEAISSGAFIMRKNVFLEVGGFNDALEIGEDTDLSRKIRKKGYKILLDTKSVIYNTGYPKSISSFIRREFWHGDSWQTIIIHKKIDSLTVYLIMNMIVFIISFIYAIKGYLISLAIPIGHILLPSFIKAYKKRKSIDMVFLQLISIYIVYIMSRTIALFKFKWSA